MRLLVAELDDDGAVRPVERLMTITRLGRGVDATGQLDADALDRTVACIESYARRWSELGAQRVRISATSAVRDAANRERFFTAVAERTGQQPVVLSGELEARTAFAGATQAVQGDPPYLVLDIGGGSTEFILGTAAPEAMTSRQLGCVRLTERCIGGDLVSAAELTAMREVIDAELAAVETLMDPTAARTLVGVAGTVTTVAALHLSLPEYQPERIHNTRVPREPLRTITARLAGMTSPERARLGPMAPGREDVIVAGCLILERVVERFGFAEVVASEADILDGLVRDLLSPAAAGP